MNEAKGFDLMNFRIADTFMDSFVRLTSDEQKVVTTAESDWSIELCQSAGEIRKHVDFHHR